MRERTGGPGATGGLLRNVLYSSSTRYEYQLNVYTARSLVLPSSPSCLVWILDNNLTAVNCILGLRYEPGRSRSQSEVCGTRVTSESVRSQAAASCQLPTLPPAAL